MNFSQAQIGLLLTEWIFIYCVYRGMGVFFDQKLCENRKREILSYIIFAVINSITFMFFFYPLLVMSVSTIMFYLLTLNYQGSVKRRIGATITITANISIAEALAVVMVRDLPGLFQKYDPDCSFLIALLSRGLALLIIIYVERLQNLKKRIEVPMFRWLIIVFVPILSVGLLIWMSLLGVERAFCNTCFVILLMINGLSLFLYNNLIAIQEKAEQSIIVDMENHSYKKQLEIMQEYVNVNRMLRHDVKNHVIALQGLLEQGQEEDALEYLRKAAEVYGLYENKVNTGNVELDSLFNYKLSQTDKLHITVELKLEVPEQCMVHNFDLSIIIGNLLDNAMEALEKLPEEKRKLKLEIRYSKGRMFIYSANPYCGEIRREKGRIVTSKPDAALHGVGLRSVETVIQKYHGEMEINTKDAVFLVQIILYT